MTLVDSSRSKSSWLLSILMALGLWFGASFMCFPSSYLCGMAFAATNDEDELVYLDPSGVIRVLDSSTPADTAEVQWRSPTAGWLDLALGDVNGDGDQEILAVGVPGGVSKLTVFDPVAGVSDIVPGQEINGIPWAILYERELPGWPYLVRSGAFDLGTAGDEIILSYDVPFELRDLPEDSLRIEVLAYSTAATGVDMWEPIAAFGTGNPWTWIATGNLDGQGIDEVVLVAEDLGNLSAYRIDIDGEFERIFRNSISTQPWSMAEVGNYRVDDPFDLVAIREADWPLSSMWVFHLDGEVWEDGANEAFIPSPDYFFLADVSGNGDQEIVMLRGVTQQIGERPRLFVRDNGNDVIALREAALDLDNGYRVGVGGDFDGDGRDEFAIMRDNRIRIYTAPEQSSANVEFTVESNRQTIRTGNLDANGLSVVPQLSVSPEDLAVTMKPGTRSPTYALTVINANTSWAFPVTVKLEDAATWVSVVTDSATTPIRAEVQFITRGLKAGTYTNRLLIESPDERLSDDLPSVDLRLVVESGVSTVPDRVIVAFAPCEGAEAVERLVAVEGTAGASYAVNVDPTVEWLSISPTSGLIPGTVTLVVDPSRRTAAAQQTDLDIRAELEGDEIDQVATQVFMLCAEEQLYLPHIQH